MVGESQGVLEKAREGKGGAREGWRGQGKVKESQRVLERARECWRGQYSVR